MKTLELELRTKFPIMTWFPVCSSHHRRKLRLKARTATKSFWLFCPKLNALNMGRDGDATAAEGVVSCWMLSDWSTSQPEASPHVLSPASRMASGGHQGDMLSSGGRLHGSLRLDGTPICIKLFFIRLWSNAWLAIQDTASPDAIMLPLFVHESSDVHKTHHGKPNKLGLSWQVDSTRKKSNKHTNRTANQQHTQTHE